MAERKVDAGTLRVGDIIQLAPGMPEGEIIAIEKAGGGRLHLTVEPPVGMATIHGFGRSDRVRLIRAAHPIDSEGEA